MYRSLFGFHPIKILILLISLLSSAAYAYGTSTLPEPPFDYDKYKNLASERYKVYQSYGYGLTFMKPADQLTFPLLKKAIVDNDFRSVEEVLPYIKENYPMSLEQYVVMYESRSLQDASPENPRILALAGSKQMVFSFNGKKGQKGFDNLEIMHFDPVEDRFEFHEITFNSRSKARFSGANPAKCMNCHQAKWRKQPDQNDPRPNWEPYNTWPGAIGSLDGELRFYASESHRYNNDNDRHMLAKAYNEPKWIIDFEDQIMPDHPRYKFLGSFKGPRFVLEFTKVMAILNSKRLARILYSQQDVYQSLRPTLSMILNADCNYMYSEDTSKYISGGWHGYYKAPLSQELEALYGPLGFNTEDWSMDFRTGGRLANDGKDRLANPHSPEPFLAVGLEKYDPEAFGPISTRFQKQGSESMGNARKLCEEMKAKKDLYFTQYEDLIGKIVLNPEFTISNVEEPLINRCISCHADATNVYTGNAPFIPFDVNEKLAKALVKKGYPRGSLMDEIKHRTGEYAKSGERMPKGHVPSLEQVNELVSYLESLVE